MQNDSNLPVPQSTDKKKMLGAWGWLIASIVYVLSPFDLIPDIPLIGWVDDFFLLSAAVLNLVQTRFGETKALLARIANMLKWIMLVLAIIVILLVLLLGTVLLQICVKLE